mmetsp:Transcript_13475/g.23983  ORF Transcript_13475/g.23983 Transcript_13475/m.23983 type:complete len:700 (+) Transcript_13475:97-2196(+)
MESSNPVAVAAAVVVSSVLLFVGKKVFGGSSNDDAAAEKKDVVSEQPQEGSSKAPKKKKKKSKSKSKKAAAQPKAETPAETEAPAKAETPAKVEAPVKVEEPLKVEEPVKKNAPVASKSSKKKKGKKGNGNAAAANEKAQQEAKAKAAAAEKEKEAARAAEAEEAAQAVAIAEAAEAAAKAAAQAEADEDGWETVKSRKKKPAAAPSNDGAQVNMDESGTATLQLEVGDFAPTIIGPGGLKIAEIQQTSGAKVNVDKNTKSCTITGSKSEVEQAKDIIVGIIGSQKKDTIELGKKRGLVFGPNGETIRKIQSQSGARIEMDRNSTVCTVSGNDTAVDAAKAAIMEILNSTKIGSVPLGEKDSAAIIGKGGENIKRLQAETGASIDIDNESSVCLITGEPEQVAKAEELVKLYIEHRGPPPEATQTLVMSIHNGRLLIGKQGATVQQMQNSTNTRINIKHGVSDSTVTVSGDTADVARCVVAINKLIDDNSHQVTITLSSLKLKSAILGTGGATVKKVREETDARIEVEDTFVTIFGTKAQIAKAKSLVDKIIAKELGPPEVPAGEIQHQVDLGSATGKIIGTAGANIARLEKEHGASIMVKNGTMCYVTGKEDAVNAIKKEIDEVLERHAANLEKARKQDEELAKVAAQNGSANPADQSGAFAQFDVPALETTWGVGFSASPGEWGQATPAANGSAGGW